MGKWWESLPFTELSLFDVREYGVKMDGVTDDTAAWTQALTEAEALGYGVFFPAGTSRLTSTLTLPPTVPIIGIDRTLSVFLWDGPAGGIVLSTADLSTSPEDYIATLEKIGIVYPSTLMAAGSRGIYIAMPNGTLNDVQVETDHMNLVPGPVSGTAGIELDGVLNAGATPVRCKVGGGQWEHGVYVRANHVEIRDSNFYYLEHGIGVDSDSQGSGGNQAPSNLVAMAHSFETTGSSLHVIRATSVNISGMHESPPASGSAPMILCESTFTNGAVVSSINNLYDACTRVKSFTTSGKVIDLNPKTGEIIRWVGQASGTALIAPPNSQVPTVVAGPALGTSPPAPVILAGGSTGFTVAFGTGTAPTTGKLVSITFAEPYQSQPIVLISPENSGTRGLNLWTARATTTGVDLYCDTAPGASVPANSYHVNVQVLPPSN